MEIAISMYSITLSKQEQIWLVRICIGWWIHVSKYYTTHQEKEKIISPSLIRMFSNFIYEQLGSFNFFEIQCFPRSFLIENLFLFIISSATSATDMLKYLAKNFCKTFSELWWVTTMASDNNSENLAKPIKVG